MWIYQLIWARGFCGIKICCSASVDCSGTIGKIHVVEIEGDQGVARACHHDWFLHLETFDKAPWSLQSSGVCADAQCCKIIWLEELALESNTIQAQEDITLQGKTAGQEPRTLYIKIGRFIVHISGFISSFGLAAFVSLEWVVVLRWIAAGQPGKSIWQRLK